MAGLSLRDQVYAVAKKAVLWELLTQGFVDAVGFPRLIEELCIIAFLHNWNRPSDSWECMVIKTAYNKMKTGFISEDEPGI